MPTAEIKQLLETSEHSSIQGVVVVVREELAGLARPSSSTPRGGGGGGGGDEGDGGGDKIVGSDSDKDDRNSSTRWSSQLTRGTRVHGRLRFKQHKN